MRLRGLGMIVRRSLRQHVLSTFVTVVSVALGVGLVMAVFVVSERSRSAFAGGDVGFDAVLGARGSPLQLVMNTVFHLETSPGNVPWNVYEEIARHPAVELAVPYAVGDNFRGFRVVGTTPEMFTKFEYQAGSKLTPKVGRTFDERRSEAVIGYTVALQSKLRVGAKFNPSHGVGARGTVHKAEYVVVGILEPTNSPTDKVIWIPIEGIFRMDGHRLRGSGQSYVPKDGVAIPTEHKEVSAVMLKFKDGAEAAGAMLDQQINKQGTATTLAWPIAAVVADLFNKLGWVTDVLRLVAYLVVVVAAASILASLYNTMNERRREFAILRALGAQRTTVFGVIVMESTVIALLGALLGFVVYFVILAVVAELVREQTGVVIPITAFDPILVWTPIGMTLLGAVAGLLPAWKAYSTDVAANLVPST